MPDFADIMMSKNDNPDPVVTGNQLFYSLTVTNNGPGVATGMTITDTLAPSASFVAASPGCAASNGVVTCDLAALAPGASADFSVTVTASCALSTGDTLLNNAAVVSLTTPDPNAANNTATAVTTALNPPPVITCPADIVVPNDPGLCSAVMSYDIPVAVDNCPGATVSCTQPPGSVFPKGTTSVSCVATDSGGATGTCGFTVTVNDVEPPKVTCSVGQGRLRPVNDNLVNVGLAVTATDYW